MKKRLKIVAIINLLLILMVSCGVDEDVEKVRIRDGFIKAVYDNDSDVITELLSDDAIIMIDGVKQKQTINWNDNFVPCWKDSSYKVSEHHIIEPCALGDYFITFEYKELNTDSTVSIDIVITIDAYEGEIDYIKFYT